MEKKNKKTTNSIKNQKVKRKSNIIIEDELEENKIGEIESIKYSQSKSKESKDNKKVISPNLQVSSSFDPEFLEGLKTIDNIITKTVIENRIYLFFSKLENETIKFTIYQREKIWNKKFVKSDFEDIKEKMSLEGNWKSFFDSFEKAINKKNGGNFFLLHSKDKKEKLIMKLFHPISSDLKIKSEIIFEEYISDDDLSFNKISFNLCVDSVTFYEKKTNFFIELSQNKDKIKETQQSNKPDIIGNYDLKSSQNFESKKNLKRKFVSDLINPNLKKRKAVGNKFMNSSISSNEEIE